MTQLAGYHELQAISLCRHRLNRSRAAWESAIRDAVKADIPKVRVAREAGISRPTLDRILNR